MPILATPSASFPNHTTNNNDNIHHLLMSTTTTMEPTRPPMEVYKRGTIGTVKTRSQSTHSSTTTHGVQSLSGVLPSDVTTSTTSHSLRGSNNEGNPISNARPRGRGRGNFANVTQFRSYSHMNTNTTKRRASYSSFSRHNHAPPVNGGSKSNISNLNDGSTGTAYVRPRSSSSTPVPRHGPHTQQNTSTSPQRKIGFPLFCTTLDDSEHGDNTIAESTTTYPTTTSSSHYLYPPPIHPGHSSAYETPSNASAYASSMPSILPPRTYPNLTPGYDDYGSHFSDHGSDLSALSWGDRDNNSRQSPQSQNSHRASYRSQLSSHIESRDSHHHHHHSSSSSNNRNNNTNLHKLASLSTTTTTTAKVASSSRNNSSPVPFSYPALPISTTASSSPSSGNVVHPPLTYDISTDRDVVSERSQDSLKQHLNNSRRVLDGRYLFLHNKEKIFFVVLTFITFPFVFWLNICLICCVITLIYENA
jgi:hypothetical protein